MPRNLSSYWTSFTKDNADFLQTVHSAPDKKIKPTADNVKVAISREFTSTTTYQLSYRAISLNQGKENSPLLMHYNYSYC